NGVDGRRSYDTIEKANNKEFSAWVKALTPAAPGEEGLSASDIQWYVDHPVETHYFYPNQREVLLKKMDRDRDGVTDADDTVFNVVYPRRVDAAGGYDPLDPGAPLDGLDGTALNGAVSQLNLFARYAQLPPGLLGPVPWNPDVFQGVGFHEGSAADERAFRFELDPANGKIKTSLNSNYAHAPAEALARMLAIEAGQFVGRQAGFDDARTAALALSFLERVVHQGGAPGWSASPIDTREVKEKLLETRYQLGLSVRELMAASGDPDDFTPSTWEAIVARVNATPAALGLASVEPRRASEALPVPADMRVGGRLDAAALQALLGRLGVDATVDPAAHPFGVNAGPGTRLVVSTRDRGGAPSYVSLGIDSEGVVRAAARITP
ncbi:MAG: hypothetical protein INH41_05225, partial [Myxococcaceae bacterium]|nr:hypothetical protein [Myxococcaceae bacterium]